MFLIRENKKIQLIRASVDEIPTIETEIRVIDEDYTFKETLFTTTFSKLSSLNETVLITAKIFGNTEIAKRLSKLEGDFDKYLIQKWTLYKRAI